MKPLRRALLDSDILSEVLKRKDPVVLRRAIEYIAAHGIFTLSAVSVHEIMYGLHRKSAEHQIRESRQAFLKNEVLLPTFEDFDRSGVIRAEGQRRGQQLGLADCLIGAIAERIGLPLVTGNTAHFQAMIDSGLQIQLENWRDA